MSVYQLVPPAEAIQDYITWENGFSQSEIQRLRVLGDSLAQESATVSDNQIHDIRKSRVGWIQNNEDSVWLYDKLGFIARQLNAQFYGFDLFGFVDDLQYTVYTGSGDHYGWHVDRGSDTVAPRKLSMTVQLSAPDEYEGGDLEFMINGDRIDRARREQGLVYVFPSFVMHQVTPVTRGTRRSLVVWLSGPKFR